MLSITLKKDAINNTIIKDGKCYFMHPCRKRLKITNKTKHKTCFINYHRPWANPKSQDKAKRAVSISQRAIHVLGLPGDHFSTFPEILSSIL